MTQPLTTEQLEAIRERRASIGAGDWYAPGEEHGSCGEEVRERTSGYNARHDRVIAETPPDARGVASFLAHAPTDIDALLAEVERLRAALDRAEEWFSHLCRSMRARKGEWP